MSDLVKLLIYILSFLRLVEEYRNKKRKFFNKIYNKFKVCKRGYKSL